MFDMGQEMGFIGTGYGSQSRIHMHLQPAACRETAPPPHGISRSSSSSNIKQPTARHDEGQNVPTMTRA